MTFSVIATDLAENQADANTTITEANSVSTMTILRSKPVITVKDMLVANADPADADSSFIERLTTYSADFFTAANSAGIDITADVTEVSNNLDTDTADSTPYEIVYTVTDSAGNVSLDTTVQLTVVDTTGPEVAQDASNNEILTVTSNNTLDADDYFGYSRNKITIAFTSDEELHASDAGSGIETSVTFTNGTTEKTAIDLVQKTGSTNQLEWVGEYTVAGPVGDTAGDNGLVSYVLKMTDIYGNVTTTTSANSDVTVDTTSPTASSITVTGTRGIGDDAVTVTSVKTGDAVTISFTSSEQLHGIASNNTASFIYKLMVMMVKEMMFTLILNLQKRSMIQQTQQHINTVLHLQLLPMLLLINPLLVLLLMKNYQYSLQLTDLAGNVTTTDYADSGMIVDRIALLLELSL